MTTYTQNDNRNHAEMADLHFDEATALRRANRELKAENIKAHKLLAVLRIQNAALHERIQQLDTPIRLVR